MPNRRSDRDRTILSLRGTCDAVADGALNAQDAIDACWARARRLQSDFEAFAFLPESAPHAGSGPLAGVAVAVKDLMDTADMPTSYGSRIFSGHRPTADAAVVQSLRDLGATVLGKSVTTEFAWQQPGPTRNPWNPAHTPGGSSSGSAAAVAAGIVPLALGTQTFGSIIRPAAYCGIVGFKPSFGTLSRVGVKPLSGSLDHVGLFARSTEDIAAILPFLAPTGKGDEPFRGSPRFGLLPISDAAVSREQRLALETAASALGQGGAGVEEARIPEIFATIPAIAKTLLAYEAARLMAPLLATRGRDLSASIRELVVDGQGVSAAQYAEALDQQQAVRAAHARLMQDFDGLLTIPAAGEAPAGLDRTGDPRFCVPWTVIGAPAITLPVAIGQNGLPLGLQIVGRWGENAALIGAALAVVNLLPRFPARQA